MIRRPPRLLNYVEALCVLLLCFGARPGLGQGQPQADERLNPNYVMKLAVDEVVLTFHATDRQGLSVNDIRAGDIRLLDAGAPPRRIVSFEALLDRPMRAALLMDTSESMQRGFAESKVIAEQFAERVFRPKTDRATLMDFGYSSDFLQPWTSDKPSLSRSIQAVRLGRMNPQPGTAIADTVFRACYYGFNRIDPGASGNVIFLFSDGEDNSGQVSLEEALRACQQSNAVIYAFRFPSDNGSSGSKTLQDLAAGTGGRVFPADDLRDAILGDLKTIESEVRNQYRLIYNPAHLEHNGRFHSIELQLPDRVRRMEVRSGYFAPER